MSKYTNKEFRYGKWRPILRKGKPTGEAKKWFAVAKMSEARFKSKIEPLPDYDTTFDGWRER